MAINMFLEKDVPECYYKMAVLMGSVDYYMLYETWAGEPLKDGPRKHRLSELPYADGIVTELNRIVKAVFIDKVKGDAREAVKDDILALRERIKNLALGLSAYSDVFILYEYIINRSKPVDKASLKPFNNDAEARDVLSAIFSSGENAEINESIKFAVSQLPLRMSKAKFYDIVKNSFEKYTGTDSSSLERLLYMIRTGAGIDPLNSEVYPELEKMREYLAGINYEDISEDKYAEVLEAMTSNGSLILDTNEFYTSAVNVLNKLAIAVLAGAYSDVPDTKETDISKTLAREAMEGLESDTNSEMTEVVLESLKRMEGMFEPLMMALQRIQSKVSKEMTGAVDEHTMELVKTFDKCERLMSNSVYADLEDKTTSELDAKTVEESYNAFKDDFSAVIANDSRLMQRARMASVLSLLPVFFDSRTDVMNYVRDSLDSCRDVFEKMVAVRLIVDNTNAKRVG